jgi:hypothetical protein
MDLPATGWRLPDDACALLARLVEEHRPALVVECGSGRSTAVLAEAMYEFTRGKLVSLEHEFAFAEQTRALLTGMNLAWLADVRYAPLEPHGKPGLLTDQWYARKFWEDLQGIGMLVVDGPPGGTSRYARHPALPLLRDRLLPSCVVVLDDLNRDPEKAIVRDWEIEMTLVKHAKATIGYGTFNG